MCLSPESVPHVSLFSDKHPSREWCHRHVPCIQSPPTEVKFRYTCPFLSPGLRTLLFFLAPVPLAATLSPFTTCHGQRDRRGLHVRSASNNTRGGGWGGGLRERVSLPRENLASTGSCSAIRELRRLTGCSFRKKMLREACHWRL